MPGILKRPRLDGEVPAKEMATALQVNLSRVHQLWREGMSRTSVQDALEWRRMRFERSSANPARSVDFESDSSDSSFGEGLDSCDSGSDTGIDDDVVSLHLRSRNLSGVHSICPQLMDLCLA